MQNLIDAISNEVGSIYRDRTNQSNQRLMQNRGIVAEEEKMILADSLSGNRQAQQNAFLIEKLKQEIDAGIKRDSIKDASNFRELEARLEANAKAQKDENEFALKKYKMEMDNVIAKLGATMQAGKEEKKYDAELEKKKLRDAYIPPNLRGGLADFFNEDKTMGLDESEMIDAYMGPQGNNSRELRQMVGELNRLDVPKDDPKRKSAENLVMDIWKHLNMSDQGADFLDGGGILGWLGIDNTEAVQARAIYDEVQTMLMQLGIPQEEWKNKRWIQKGY